MKKFLIIQTASIGDVVLATPIVEKLHQHFPDSEIDFLLRKGNEGLLEGHPLLGRVLSWDKKNHKLLNLWRLLFIMRKTKYDKVINVQRFASTGVLTAFSGAKETIGFDKNPFSFLFTKKIKHVIGSEKNSRHEIERNAELVESFTDKAVLKPRLYPAINDEEKVYAYQGRAYITISPASLWFTKQYPKEKWIEFINGIPVQYTIYLLGAAADFSLGEEIKNKANRPVTNLSGKLSFLQSAALMKRAAMNYVNDSAAMHFASAVNAPVTVVYCSTVPWFGFGPLSDKTEIVEIRDKLSCRPCSLHGRKACPLGHFNCAHKIEVSQLLATLPALS